MEVCTMKQTESVAKAAEAAHALEKGSRLVVFLPLTRGVIVRRFGPAAKTRAMDRARARKLYKELRSAGYTAI
jgi:hypothetical protein